MTPPLLLDLWTGKVLRHLGRIQRKRQVDVPFSLRSIRIVGRTRESVICTA